MQKYNHTTAQCIQIIIHLKNMNQNIITMS